MEVCGFRAVRFGDISRDEASRPGRGACGQGGESIVKRVRRSALINTQVSN